MLASWPDDGPDARKYELWYGRSRSERLSDSRQGLHDPDEPPSYGSGEEARSREPHTSRRHGARWRPAEVIVLVSVDELDALRSQRTRVSTSDTRDPGWTAPPDAFLRLTCCWRRFAPFARSDADRYRDRLSHHRRCGDSTGQCQTRRPGSPVHITLYRVDGTARRAATGRAGARVRRRVGTQLALGSLKLSHMYLRYLGGRRLRSLGASEGVRFAPVTCM